MRWEYPCTQCTSANHELIRRVEKLVTENIDAIRFLIKLFLLLVNGLHCSENSLGASETSDQISK